MIAIIIFSTFILGSIYVVNTEISTREFLISLVLTIFLTLIIYAISIVPYPNDILFLSSRIKETVYHPFFIEQYQQPHTICHSCGKDCTTCHTYYTTEYAKHEPYWTAKDDLYKSWKISASFHNELKNSFGNHKIITKPNKCTYGGHVHSGDPYLYTYKNETNTFDYPTNKVISWHNPVKDTHSIFNSKSKFKKDYPVSQSMYTTNRRMTSETNITQKEWDSFNTKLYESVKVNLILVKLNKHEETKELEQSWVSGKKNDLIICFVGDYKKPEYVKVFGWSKSSLVKLKLESYLLEKGIQKDSLNMIEHIIKSYYEPYDFKKFNYLNTPVALWIYVLCLIISVGCIVAFSYIFSDNYEDKNHSDPNFFG